MNKKICNKCKNEKPLEDFGKNKSTKDGHKGICKECNKNRVTKVCVYCKQEFKARDNRVDCCSRKCSGLLARADRIKCKCDSCNKDLELTVSRFNRSERHFCSVKCMGEGESLFNTGINSKNWKGGEIQYSCDICGKDSSGCKAEYQRYQHHYCSIECKDKGQTVFYSGTKAKLYNEDISEVTRESERMSNENVQWRKQVFDRDKYTCKCCGLTNSGDLNAHHLNGYHWDIENRYNIDNGVTLCEVCHKDFHSIYGRGKNTVDEYNEFIEDIQNDWEIQGYKIAS